MYKKILHQLKKLKLDQSGFSVAQVLVAAGIAGGLALVFSELGQQQMKTQQTNSTTLEIDQLVSRVATIMSKSESCTENFTVGSPPSLKSSTQLVYRRADGSTVTLLDISGNQAENIRKGFTITSIGLSTTTTSSNMRAIEIVFNRNPTGKKQIFGAAEVTKEVPIKMEIESGNFISCYSDLSQAAIAGAKEAALEVSCGIGLVYNNDPNDPKCIVNTAVDPLSQCPTNYRYFDRLEVTGSANALDFNFIDDDCAKVACETGQIGQVISNQSTCFSPCSGAGEVGFWYGPGVSCQQPSCPSGQMLIGFSDGGSPVCRDLVDSTEASLNCTNGSKFVTTGSGNGLKRACCDPCPTTSNTCEGTLVSTTTDCGVVCEGTKAYTDYSYSSWSSCSWDSTEGMCTETRTQSCSGGCCKVQDAASGTTDEKFDATKRQCYTGTWRVYTTADCPTTSTVSTVLQTYCTIAPGASLPTQWCCDPSTRPDPIYCGPFLEGGDHQETECSDLGGNIYTHSSKNYCKFSGSCPSGWTMAYNKTSNVSGTGSSHLFCGDLGCSTGNHTSFQRSVETCSYNDYHCYDTWSASCYSCGATINLTATITESLCY
jgi:hypothetical protein